MSETMEFDLKQVVVLNDTFGPREVRQMQEAIARDFSQYAVLRDAVGELQTREDHTPASRVRLGVCLYLLGRYYRAIEVLEAGRWRGDGPLLPCQVPFRPPGVPRGDRKLPGRREGRLRWGPMRVGPSRGAPLRRRCHRRLGHARCALRRDRANGRVPGAARRHGVRAGRQSAGGGGAL